VRDLIAEALGSLKALGKAFSIETAAAVKQIQARPIFPHLTGLLPHLNHEKDETPKISSAFFVLKIGKTFLLLPRFTSI